MVTNEKIGTVSLQWEAGEGEDIVKFIKTSPKSFYEESEKIMHTLNQKSVSGQMLLDFAVNYLTEIRTTRKELPDNARLVCYSETSKSIKNFSCNLNDFEGFILNATQLSFESEAIGDSAESDDPEDMSWLEDDTEDSEEESDVESAEVLAENN